MTTLKTYSFTEMDIDLITYALRRLKDESVFSDIRNDSEDLINYIEVLKEDHKVTSQNTID